MGGEWWSPVRPSWPGGRLRYVVGAARPATASGTLEQLAARAACQPVLSTDSAELRQANCTTKDGRYVLATFATDRGQREWINEAEDYGGVYLVGRKWVAVGGPAGGHGTARPARWQCRDRDRAFRTLTGPERPGRAAAGAPSRSRAGFRRRSAPC